MVWRPTICERQTVLLYPSGSRNWSICRADDRRRWVAVTSFSDASSSVEGVCAQVHVRIVRSQQQQPSSRDCSWPLDLPARGTHLPPTCLQQRDANPKTRQNCKRAVSIQAIYVRYTWWATPADPCHCCCCRMDCGYIGVTHDPARSCYKARIHFEGKEHYIGR